MAEQEQTTAPAEVAPAAPAEPSHEQQHKQYLDEIRGKAPVAPPKEEKVEPVKAEATKETPKETPKEKPNRGDQRFGKLKAESSRRINDLQKRIKALEAQIKPRDQYESDAAHAAATASVETAKQIAQSEIVSAQDQMQEADRELYAEKVSQVSDQNLFNQNLQQYGKWIDENDPITHDFAMTHENGFQVLDFVMRQFAVPGMLEKWAKMPLYKRAEILNGLSVKLSTPEAPAPVAARPAAPALARSIAPESGERVSAQSSDFEAQHRANLKQIRSGWNNR